MPTADGVRSWPSTPQVRRGLPRAGSPRVGLLRAGLRRGLGRLWRDESGNGPITATGGVLMFLFFLFATVQVSLHLYATTQAAAIALEGASRVAHGAMGCDDATAWVDAQVAGWPGVAGSCTIVGDTVEVEVAGDSPAPALRILGSVARLDSIRRTASMRLETFQ